MAGTIRVTNQGNWPSVEAGTETVTTAGTAEQLNGGESQPVPDGARIHLTADPGNSGGGNSLYVGDSDVDASESIGYPMTPEQEIDLSVTDVSTLWIDAEADGDSVNWIVETDD